MTDKSTTAFEYVEYQQRDANQMDKPDGGLSRSKHEIWMRTYYHIKQYLRCLADWPKRISGSGDYATDEITLRNGGWSLFRSGKYEMNNNTVEEINEILP